MSRASSREPILLHFVEGRSIDRPGQSGSRGVALHLRSLSGQTSRFTEYSRGFLLQRIYPQKAFFTTESRKRLRNSNEFSSILISESAAESCILFADENATFSANSNQIHKQNSLNCFFALLYGHTSMKWLQCEHKLPFCPIDPGARPIFLHSRSSISYFKFLGWGGRLEVLCKQFQRF